MASNVLLLKSVVGWPQTWAVGNVVTVTDETALVLIATGQGQITSQPATPGQVFLSLVAVIDNRGHLLLSVPGGTPVDAGLAQGIGIQGPPIAQGPWTQVLSYNASTNSPPITAGGGGYPSTTLLVVTTPGTITVDAVGAVNQGDWLVGGGTKWTRIQPGLNASTGIMFPDSTVGQVSGNGFPLNEKDSFGNVSRQVLADGTQLLPGAKFTKAGAEIDNLTIDDFSSNQVEIEGDAVFEASPDSMPFRVRDQWGQVVLQIDTEGNKLGFGSEVAPTAAVQPPPVTERPPAITDGTNKDYSQFDYWNRPGVSLMQCLRSGAAAAWTRSAVTGRPCDVVTGATAAYGMRRLVQGYAGPLFRAVNAANAVLDVSCAAGSDEADYAALDAFSPSSRPTVSILYDQTGNGNHITQTTAANRPTVVPVNRMGKGRSLTFHSKAQGGGVAITMNIPASLTAAANAVSVVSYAAFRCAIDSNILIQLSGSPNNIWFGWGTSSSMNFVNRNGYSSGPSRPLAQTPQVYGFASGATNLDIWVDNEVKSQTVAAFTQATAGGILGASATDGTGGTVMEIGALVIYPRAITATERQTVSGALYAAFDAAPQVRVVYIAGGDSITEGWGSDDGRNYPRQMMDLLSRPAKIYDLGAFGETIEAITPSAGGVLSRCPYPNSLTVLTFAAGTNNLQGSDAAIDMYNAASNYLSVVKGQGVDFTVITTLLPRTGLTADQAQKRLDYNTLVRANSAGWDAVVDLTTDPTIGVDAAASNTALFADGLHPTSLGYSYVAPLIADAVNKLLSKYDLT